MKKRWRLLFAINLILIGCLGCQIGDSIWSNHQMTACMSEEKKEKISDDWQKYEGKNDAENEGPRNKSSQNEAIGDKESGITTKNNGTEWEKDEEKKHKSKNNEGKDAQEDQAKHTVGDICLSPFFDQEHNQEHEQDQEVLSYKNVKVDKLSDFDYLLQNYYIVDSSTTVGKDLLDAKFLLEESLRVQKKIREPEILIYHTHSQEGYVDSVEGNIDTTVVGVGDYLAKLLEEKYGFFVLHHRECYDVNDRDHAYSNALEPLQKILDENPSIQLVLDIHRDSVDENTHLVTEINGKPTAQIMFFNGLSRTTALGELTSLPNPNLEENLACSFQMELAAKEFYPDFTRRIYLKGYRYNMHLCPKSMLIEVGAQNNTLEEAKNAMEPLADLIWKVFGDQ